MLNTFYGLKKEMTQVFSPDGTVVPVTIVDLSQTKVIKVVDNNEERHVFIGVGSKKGKFAEKERVVLPRFVRSLVAQTTEEVSTGDLVIDQSIENQKAQVTGTTKGKGFQGVVKRWGFKGGKRTHGQSDRMRAPGSIASGTTLGRVNKGKKMGGHMGAKTKTIRNLKIQKVDLENKLLLVAGAIPGNKDSLVKIEIIS